MNKNARVKLRNRKGDCVSIIKNGLVFTEKAGFEQIDIRIENGRIAELGRNLRGNDIIDAVGLYVVPGFVDIHTHGAVGCDFCDASVDGLKAIVAYERSVGVTSFCPTSMTFPKERLVQIFSTVREFKNQKGESRVLGINMEGPFISPKKAGAQNADDIRKPDIEMFRSLQQLSGNKIKLVTIAPEEDEAYSFISALSKEVHISIGHTNADVDVADKAFLYGADHVTHLFNAMPEFFHRNPGVVGAAQDHENVYVELIGDLIHMHPAMIRSVYKLFGEDRIVLISDSMEATGMPDGVYELGGQKVYKKGRQATLEDGTLAGSVTNLYECFCNAVDVGIPLEAALKMVTCNPAKSIGIQDMVGVIKKGAFADLLLLDGNRHMIRVI